MIALARAVAFHRLDRFRDLVQSPRIAVISNNPSRTLKHPLDKQLYAQRHLVECCFSKLKQFQRIATRFKKTAINYRAIATSPPSSYGCGKCPPHL